MTVKPAVDKVYPGREAVDPIAALRGSEERYRRITSAVTDYIFTVRIEQGRAVETTHGPGCVSITGYGGEEFAENPLLWIGMVPPEDRERVIGLGQAILAGENPEPLEHRILRKDGELRWVMNTTVPHRDPDGRLLSYDGLIRDITERKQAEQEMREKTRLVEEMNRMLEERVRHEVEQNREKEHLMLSQNRFAAMGEMINNIAHQWRQPLNNLGLMIQALQAAHEDGDLSVEEMGETVTKCMDTICFMSHTIDDFRNFFRRDPERIRFNLHQAVSRALSVVDAGLRDHFVTLDLCYEDDIWIEGYPNEFSQVIMNLLSNAKDVLIERKVAEPTLSIALYREGGHAVVSVQDNGGGIPEEIIGRIFDPYFTTKPGKGTGIGLYMSKVIVEKHLKGVLSAVNVDGGAEFRVVLPLAAAPEPVFAAPDACAAEAAFAK